jgi:hypothetical protein
MGTFFLSVFYGYLFLKKLVFSAFFSWCVQENLRMVSRSYTIEREFGLRCASPASHGDLWGILNPRVRYFSWESVKERKSM